MQNYIFLTQQPQQLTQPQNTSNAGAWALEQNLAYTIFIDIHKKSMTSKKKMRQMMFYDKLSAFIQTRSCSQSRSHHQKMFDKFKYISKIIQLFKREVGAETYKVKFWEGIERMKAINQRFSSNQPIDPQQREENAEIILEPYFEINTTLPMGVSMMVPAPLLWNNLYYFGGGCEVYYQRVEFGQNQHDEQ